MRSRRVPPTPVALAGFVLLLLAAAVWGGPTAAAESSCARALAAGAPASPSPCEATKVDKAGREQIAREEAPGGKPVKKPYNDSRGYCTIGIGHLLHKSKCTKADRSHWSKVTGAQLEKLFRQDLKRFEDELDKLVKKLKIKLTQCQYNALVDLLYNGGPSWFVSPKSRMHKALAKEDFGAIPKLIEEAIPKKADAKTKRALSKRRHREASEFKQKNCCPDYELIYRHSSSFSYSGEPERVAAAPIDGTENRSESWSLEARIPLAGTPSSGLTGSGGIDYGSASYHLEWKGDFSGQAICPGTYTDDLVGTHSGTAEVVALTFSSAKDVSLDFSPRLAEGADAPGETIHNTQSYEYCPGADNTDESMLWVGDFFGFYAANQSLAYGHANDGALVDSGWEAGKGAVFATRTVTGAFPAETPSPGSGSWTDTYLLLKKKK